MSQLLFSIPRKFTDHFLIHLSATFTFFIGYGMKFRTPCSNAQSVVTFYVLLTTETMDTIMTKAKYESFKRSPPPIFPFSSTHLLDTRFSFYFTDVKTCDQAIFAKYFYISLALFFFCNTWKWWSVWDFFFKCVLNECFNNNWLNCW